MIVDLKASRPALIASLFVIAAAALRFTTLDVQSLWNDELFSLHVAKLPLASIPGQLEQSYFHPPVYFVLLHFVVTWFGSNEWSLRLLSALFGSLTVGGVYLVARRLLSEGAAFWAALFCLVSPLHVAYSQEARPYALAAFLCLLNFVTLSAAWLEKRKSSYLLYIAVTTIALYTHHWVIFLVAVQFAYVFIDGLLRRESLRDPLVSFLVIALLYIPLLGTVTYQAQKVAASPWFWAESASPNHLLFTGLAFSGTYFKIASGVLRLPLWVQIVSGVASLVLMSLAIWNARGTETKVVHLLLVSLFGTLVLAFAVSIVRPEAYLWYRYPVIVFPLFCIVLGAGLGVVRKTYLQFALAGVLVLLNGAGTLRYYHWEKANPKSVAAYVTTIAPSEQDVIIRPAYFRELFNYYYEGKAREVNEGPFDSTIASAIRDVDRFVMITLDIPNEVRDYLDSHFEKISERKFPGEAHMGIVVDVYRRKTHTE